MGAGRRVVEIDGQVLVRPLRTWLLPATLLLPRVIPIHATIRVGVNTQDKVRCLWLSSPVAAWGVMYGRCLGRDVSLGTAWGVMCLWALPGA